MQCQFYITKQFSLGSTVVFRKSTITHYEGRNSEFPGVSLEIALYSPTQVMQQISGAPVRFSCYKKWYSCKLGLSREWDKVKCCSLSPSTVGLIVTVKENIDIDVKILKNIDKILYRQQELNKVKCCSLTFYNWLDGDRVGRARQEGTHCHLE